ncbi:PD-(D/E)XK nuclease family protein [Kitasatospora sp. A2-31]|uniref:PD-(D/E)XK nuclease family protein n=1 Tax=Kitasatospora sp. A2-31 TaxID=2916414 RepID=UPI001EEEF351|nr:PD-(D/E)XK nuclease family protein [Kitasatospora sp. A2-31]MCG6499424.1 PD-(D/E)XK nuclease family protein [Kitasatospora sp. A2-31]
MIATGNDEQSRQLAELIGQFIVNAANHSPRSLQTAIGPSEIGEPCERKLSYKLLAWPTAAGEREPIAPVIGTGFHSWMEAQFTARNTGGRYKIEEKVTVRDSPIESARVRGSSDLYDRTTCTNYDWKLVGKSSLEKYRRHGPGAQYRVQAHLYGLGQENAGETPRRVAIVFVARYHELIIHVWSEPYDRQVALDALDRLDRIRQRVLDLNPEANPGTWAEIPMADDAKCRFCDWLLPGSTDLSKGCPGTASTSTRTGFEGLIA